MVLQLPWSKIRNFMINCANPLHLHFEIHELLSSSEEKEADVAIHNVFYVLGQSGAILIMTNFGVPKLIHIIIECFEYLITNWKKCCRKNHYSMFDIFNVVLIVFKVEGSWNHVASRFKIKSVTFKT